MDNQWGLTPVGQALCDCMQCTNQERRHRGALRLVELLGSEAALECARRNEMESMVAHALGAAATEPWAAAHERVKSQLESYMEQLDRIAERLADVNIPVVALKNAGIARGLFDCLGCCPMGDIDVMVRRSQFRQAHQVVLETGFHFEFRSELEEHSLLHAERSGGAEYWKLLPNGDKVWLELQWRPVAGRWIQPDQEPSSEDLMDRSVPIKGSHVRLLCPNDNLLQVALHTAKHTYVRAPGLRLHSDVDRIVSRCEVDWDRWEQLVVESHLQTAAFFSLLIPKEILGTDIPPQTLERLRPAKWKSRYLTRKISRAGLLNPDLRKFGRTGYVVFNALLYDDLLGLFRGIFPPVAWIKAQYGVHSSWWLPILYTRRIVDLLLRRANT